MTDVILKAFEMFLKLRDLLKERRKNKHTPIAFAHISTPSVANGGTASDTPPSHYLFQSTAGRYLEFGNADPVIDITLVNHADKPILLTSVGVEIVWVAQTWWVGGVIEPQVIKVSDKITVTIPDVWAILEKRGFWTKLARMEKSTALSDFGDMKNIGPQHIQLPVLRDLPDPVYLNPGTPYRYTLTLDKYRVNVPDYALLRLLVGTDYGSCTSDLIYVFVAAHILHVVAKDEIDRDEKSDELVAGADRHFRMGEYAQAEPLLRQAIELLKKDRDEGDLKLLTLTHNLAILYQNQGKYADAHSLYAYALPLLERRWGSDNAEYLKCKRDFNLLQQEMKGESERPPVAISEAGEPLVNERLFAEMTKLEKEGHYDQAVQIARQFSDSAEELFGPDHEHTAFFLHHLGADLYRKGSMGEAREVIERSLRIRKERLGKDHPDVARSLSNLAAILRDLGDHSESRRLYEEAIRILKRAGEAEKDSLQIVMGYYAKLLRMVGRGREDCCGGGG